MVVQTRLQARGAIAKRQFCGNDPAERVQVARCRPIRESSCTRFVDLKGTLDAILISPLSAWCSASGDQSRLTSGSTSRTRGEIPGIVNSPTRPMAQDGTRTLFHWEIGTGASEPFDPHALGKA